MQCIHHHPLTVHLCKEVVMVSSYLAVSSVFWDCKGFPTLWVGGYSFISESSLQKYIGRLRVHYGKTLACPTNYSVTIIALCFCDGAQLTKTFCMYLLQVVPK